MTPRTPAKYWARLQSTAAQRSRHCQVWRWLSTKPGMTIMSAPSMILASTGPMSRFTSAMRLPSSRMSPPRRSPIFGSIVMIVAFLIRVRCMSSLLSLAPGRCPAHRAAKGWFTLVPAAANRAYHHRALRAAFDRPTRFTTSRDRLGAMVPVHRYLGRSPLTSPNAKETCGDEFGHRTVEKTAGPPKVVCACPM